MAYICIQKIPFGLKNVIATLSQEMKFSFHDIKHIVEPYLDNLPSHSWKRKDHPDHLRLDFERCRHYKIRLNPLKCIFCVESGWLLSFMVSNRGIRVDPLKVEAVINMPPPQTIRKLQSLHRILTFHNNLLWTMPRSLRFSCTWSRKTPHLYWMK